MALTIDVICILFLLMGAVVGLKRGVIKSATMFIGAIIVIFLAFSLKNTVAKLMYTYLPFFDFAGNFEGLSVLNIIIYEALAFVLVYIVLMSVLQVLIKITGVFEKILDFTIILGIPSKILGAIFGFLEAYLFLFVALFLLSSLPSTAGVIMDGPIASKITTSSPVLSNISNEYFTAFKDIINVSTDIKGDKNRYNLECLDILLRYNIVDKESVIGLLDSGKLVVPGASDILKKY